MKWHKKITETWNDMVKIYKSQVLTVNYIILVTFILCFCDII